MAGLYFVPAIHRRSTRTLRQLSAARRILLAGSLMDGRDSKSPAMTVEGYGDTALNS